MCVCMYLIGKHEELLDDVTTVKAGLTSCQTTVWFSLDPALLNKCYDDERILKRCINMLEQNYVEGKHDVEVLMNCSQTCIEVWPFSGTFPMEKKRPNFPEVLQSSCVKGLTIIKDQMN